MLNKQTANLLGLCQRAGKLLSGDAQVKNSIKERKAVLVLLAADASERTKKEYYHLAKANSIPIIETGTKLELGWSAGKSPRAALAVSDENFARGITEIIERGEA